MKRMNLKFVIGLLPLAALPFGADAGESNDVSSCDYSYTIQRGDTLSAIARGAYGTSNYMPILRRNPKIRGRIDHIPAGEQLIMPCLGGPEGQEPNIEALKAQSGVLYRSHLQRIANDVPLSSKERSETAPASARPAKPVKSAGAGRKPDGRQGQGNAPKIAQPPRFLSATGLPPLADANPDKSGMITALITRAFEISEKSAPPQSAFERAPQQNFAALLQEGKVDIGYPVVKPDCSDAKARAALAHGAAALCTDMHFSDAYYELVMGVFARSAEDPGKESPDTPAAGNRVCQPTATLLHGMNAGKGADILATDILTTNILTVEACLEQLVAGDVDEVRADVFAAEAARTRLSLQDKIIELPDRTTVWSVHAVAPTSRPEAVAALTRLDLALATMKQDGSWLEIIRSHLSTE